MLREDGASGQQGTQLGLTGLRVSRVEWTRNKKGHQQDADAPFCYWPLACSQQLAATCYCSAYLIRCSATDVVTRLYRTFQAEHCKDVVSNDVGELLQFRQ